MAKPKHNSETEQEKLRKQQFYKILGQIKSNESEMASLKGEKKDLYDRAKKFGISKQIIDLAKKWEDMSDAEIQQQVQDIVFVAQALKVSVGRQLSILDEDQAPATEVAYDHGYKAGAMGLDNKNPYDSGKEMQAWQKGFNDGNGFRNATFAAAVAVPDDAGADGEEFEGESEDDEMAAGEAAE